MRRCTRTTTRTGTGTQPSQQTPERLRDVNSTSDLSHASSPLTSPSRPNQTLVLDNMPVHELHLENEQLIRAERLTSLYPKNPNLTPVKDVSPPQPLSAPTNTPPTSEGWQIVQNKKYNKPPRVIPTAKRVLRDPPKFIWKPLDQIPEDTKRLNYHDRLRSEPRFRVKYHDWIALGGPPDNFLNSCLFGFLTNAELNIRNQDSQKLQLCAWHYHRTMTWSPRCRQYYRLPVELKPTQDNAYK